jgi:hypothetical protein
MALRVVPLAGSDVGLLSVGGGIQDQNDADATRNARTRERDERHNA